MPIRRFDYYGQNEISKKHPITNLNGMSIAIDGFWFIKKYLIIDSEQQFLNHLSNLSNVLAPLFELNKKMSIVWIWDGLEYKKSMHLEPKVLVEKTLEKIISKKFNKTLFDQELFVEKATKLLRSNNITVIRAPYLSVAQCVYFYKKGVVDYVFSKNDALLFNEDLKLILDFNFATSEIEVINSTDLYKVNGFNLNTLRHIAFLSGCEICPTLPMYAIEFDLSAVMDIVFSNTLERRLAELKKDVAKSYLEEFLKAFIIVDYHPIMSIYGYVISLNEQTPPVDFDKIFGRKLSVETYQEIFSCSIGIKALNNIIFNKPKDNYKVRIINLFEEVFYNKIKYIKNEPIKNVFAKILDINLVDNLDLIPQIAFTLVSEHFDKETLLHLVNAGTTQKCILEPTNNSLLSIINRYSNDKLENFYKLSECILLIKDLMALMKIKLRCTGDANFEFTLGKFLNQAESDHINDFINKNENKITFKAVDQK